LGGRRTGSSQVEKRRLKLTMRWQQNGRPAINTRRCGLFWFVGAAMAKSGCRPLIGLVGISRALQEKQVLMNLKSIDDRIARIEIRQTPANLRVGRVIAGQDETAEDAVNRFLKAHPGEQFKRVIVRTFVSPASLGRS
jgi:hypothetical protein